MSKRNRRKLHREISTYLAAMEIAQGQLHPAIRAHKFGMRKHTPIMPGRA